MPSLGLLVLEADEDKRGQGHHFPHNEKKDRVAGAKHQRVGQQQQVKEGGQGSHILDPVIVCRMATADSEMSKTKNAPNGSSFTANGNSRIVTGKRSNAGEDPSCKHNQEAAMPAKPPRQEPKKPNVFASLCRRVNVSARAAPMR